MLHHVERFRKIYEAKVEVLTSLICLFYDDPEVRNLIASSSIGSETGLLRSQFIVKFSLNALQDDP